MTTMPEDIQVQDIQYEAETGESFLNWNFNGADRYDGI